MAYEHIYTFNKNIGNELNYVKTLTHPSVWINSEYLFKDGQTIYICGQRGSTDTIKVYFKKDNDTFKPILCRSGDDIKNAIDKKIFVAEVFSSGRVSVTDILKIFDIYNVHIIQSNQSNYFTATILFEEI